MKAYQPFLVALKALRLELFNCDDHPRSRLGGRKSLLVDPALVNVPESSLPDEAVGSEISRGAP